jgi:4-carboxymuconolactone decarboxylase
MRSRGFLWRAARTALIAIAVASRVFAEEIGAAEIKAAETKKEADMQTAIFPKGEKAAADYFSGAAWVNKLIDADPSGSYAVGDVVFEKGARTVWHTHPAGQVLLVTQGGGWYQERGQAARSIAKGDTVVIAPNVEHWHGAAIDSGLTHIAITAHTKDGMVVWLKPVTDREYGQLPQSRR